MELVYLWVQEYKNIKQQGFNFSPRFECTYDEITKKLTIEEKKNYISIFPENINITAIVGENGSGKSSILGSLINKAELFFVIHKNNELVIYSNNIPVSTSLQTTSFKKNFFKNILYYSLDGLSLVKAQSNLAVIDLYQTNQLITKNYAKLQTINFSLFNFIPHYIEYMFADYWINENHEIEDQDIEEARLALGWDTFADTTMISYALKALIKVDDAYLIYLFNKFETISEIFEYIDLTEKLHPKNYSLLIKHQHIQVILRKMNIPFVDKKTFDSLKKNENKKIEISHLESLFGSNYIDILFIRMSNELSFDFWAENGASYSSLSHGEKTLYSFFVNLVNFNNDDFLFLLDEPNNTLHPNWQKSFLNEIISILIQLKKSAHLVITSHSPFLLSDLPKENAIFLENGKQVYPNIETFGANIHTLLSHGFFMKDGLMGEFAKNKINEVIDYLNGKDSPIKDDDEAQRYIHIIGEPIVKKQLQRMLDSKN